MRLPWDAGSWKKLMNEDSVLLRHLNAKLVRLLAKMPNKMVYSLLNTCAFIARGDAAIASLMAFAVHARCG